MPAIDNTLHARYFDRDAVKKRNKVTLTAWSASFSAQAVPSSPDDAWVRQRVLAENMPLSLDSAVNQTLAYFLQDPSTTTNIVGFLSEDNTSDQETVLSGANDSICSAFMQRYADATVTDAQVQAWKDRNGRGKK